MRGPPELNRIAMILVCFAYWTIITKKDECVNPSFMLALFVFVDLVLFNASSNDEA